MADDIELVHGRVGDGLRGEHHDVRNLPRRKDHVVPGWGVAWDLGALGDPRGGAVGGDARDVRDGARDGDEADAGPEQDRRGAEVLENEAGPGLLTVGSVEAQIGRSCNSFKMKWSRSGPA